MLEPGKPIGKVNLVVPGQESQPAPAKDPMVSADPPAQASENPPDSPQPKPEAKEDQPKRNTQMSAKPKPKPNKTPRTRSSQSAKPKNPSEEAFMSRVRREARKTKKQIWDALGLEGDFKEEAFDEHLSQLKKTADEGRSAVERLDSRAEALEEKNAQLRAQNAKLQGELNKKTKEAQQLEEKFTTYQAEQEVRAIAQSAGVLPKAMRYGLNLFKEFLDTVPEDQEVQEEDVRKFFEGLKRDRSNRYMFREEDVSAGPESLAEEQAREEQHQITGQQGAPQGQIPSQGAPKPPAPAAGQDEAPDALKMTRQEYVQHAKEKYGYTPGMA